MTITVVRSNLTSRLFSPSKSVIETAVTSSITVWSCCTGESERVGSNLCSSRILKHDTGELMLITETLLKSTTVTRIRTERGNNHRACEILRTTKEMMMMDECRTDFTNSDQLLTAKDSSGKKRDRLALGRKERT